VNAAAAEGQGQDCARLTRCRASVDTRAPSGGVWRAASPEPVAQLTRVEGQDRGGPGTTF
jgi:hypothetical protein